MGASSSTTIVWLRRDVRLADHHALFEAAQRSAGIVCAFVLDPVLLRGPRVGAPIVQFFFDALQELRAELRGAGSDLALLEGDFATELLALADRTGAANVYYHRDDDPDALARDRRVEAALRAAGITVTALPDQTYAQPGEIMQPNGHPYTVYTPYRKRWHAAFEHAPRAPFASATAARPKLLPAAAIGPTRDVPPPEAYGHARSDRYPVAGEREAQRLLEAFVAGSIDTYFDRRNVPAVNGTSRLSPHLRAGTIGIRTCVEAAQHVVAARGGEAAKNAQGWINELIWRDFYAGLLAQFPRIAYEPFLEAGKDVRYRDDEPAYRAWCAGATGYPIVDAAMRQLNETGWMHNRLRMIVASFLTKHLLIDYHEGERYFEQHLADADLAANNGGWQWSASVGTDAAPYFRVFNPTLQGKTFDPHGTFVRSFLPALRRVPDAFVHEPWTMPPLIAAEAGCTIGRDYPAPIVDHATARSRALAVYGAALKRASSLGPQAAVPKTPRNAAVKS